MDKLKEIGISFKQLKARNEDCNVLQYFLTDPDGYYVEFCNCDILTRFCFGENAGDSCKGRPKVEADI